MKIFCSQNTGLDGAVDREGLHAGKKMDPDVIGANAANRRNFRRGVVPVAFLILAGVSGSGFLEDVWKKEQEAEKARIEAKRQKQLEKEKQRLAKEQAERQRKAELQKELDDFQANRAVWIAKAQKEDPEVRAAAEHVKKADLNHPVLKDAVMAARCADVSALAAISRNGKINWQDPEIMFAACKLPFRITVRRVHELGGDVNEKDKNGWTALMSASSRGCFEVVKYLVDHGADVNAKNVKQWTALMSASSRGCFEVVKYLVDHGADVNAKTEKQWTALMWASQRDHLDVVKYLVSKGADIDAKNNGGLTVLMMASRRGKLETVKCLISLGADVNEKNNFGWTALMWASSRGELATVKYLVFA